MLSIVFQQTSFSPNGTVGLRAITALLASLVFSNRYDIVLMVAKSQKPRRHRGGEAIWNGRRRSLALAADI
jgi:hypothetical protein